MARTKKADVIEEVIETPVVEPKKSPSVTITASYKTKTMEGEVIKHRFSGSGATAQEALNELKGSDEELVDEYGAYFPARVNLLVNVTVKRGDYQFDRALAPHNAEAIFTGKNVALLNKLFGL
jgi:hypothetical protein